MNRKFNNLSQYGTKIVPVLSLRDGVTLFRGYFHRSIKITIKSGFAINTVNCSFFGVVDKFSVTFVAFLASVFGVDFFNLNTYP